VGRRKQGPRQLKAGGPFFAVLHIKQKDRAAVGKERLVRSLQTTDHSLALKRYGVALSQLEAELQALLKPKTFKERVEGGDNGLVQPGETSLPPLELTRLTLGDFNPEDPTHEAVFNYYQSGQPLPVTWDEALDLWLKEANRNRLEPVSAGTIPKVREVVEAFSHNGQPHQITKQIVRQWIDDMEEEYKPNSIKTKKGYLTAVFSALITNDKVNTSNPFKDVKYSAKTPLAEQRRTFTDEEIRLIHQKYPQVFWMIMTGLRSGEYFSRLAKDLNGQMLTIDRQPSKGDWRPKTPSSYRRLPVPKEFELTPHKIMVSSKTTMLARELSKDIPDPTATVHSARHTFYSISRRADCNDSVIEAITGHAKKEVSRVAQSYGLFTGEVLLREAQKVWTYIENLLG
jgi:integrase